MLVFHVLGLREDPMVEGTRLAWRKSTFCGTSACVEVATSGGSVLVRDADDPDGAHLAFDRAGWKAFVDELSAGRLVRRSE